MLVHQLIHRFHHPRVRGVLDQPVTGLTHNPRAAGPGIVFVALPETQRANPHQILTALERGATAIICPPDVPLPDRGTCITVNDANEAFALAAAELCAHPSERLRIIGIRGPRASVVAGFLHQLLNLTGEKCGLLTSAGCEIADRRLPTPIGELEPIAIHEALRGLVRSACSSCVIEISDATDSHRNLCGIKLAATLDLSRDRDAQPIRGTSLHSGNHTATDLALLPGAIHFSILVHRARVVVRAPMVGRSNAEDLMHALRAALNLGVDPVALTKACTRLKPIKGVMENLRCGQPFSVFIDGASDPESLERVLANASEVSEGRLIAVIGGTADQTAAIREAIGQTAAQWADECIVTTDNPRELDTTSLARDVLQGIRHVPGAKTRVELDRAVAIRRALRLAGPKDTVLILGKGHRTLQQLDRCVIPFDDTLVAQECLAEMGCVGTEF